MFHPIRLSRSSQQKQEFLGLQRLYLDILQYGNHKDIQARVPPSDYGTLRVVSWSIRWPENSQQSSSIGHDFMVDGFKMSRDVLVAPVRICR